MNDLTIAILSAIEPPLPECLEAVKKQEGGPYRVVRIHNVFPLFAAFNAMILSKEARFMVTDARFVVQVDGDVVLKSWAVQRLYEAIRRRPLVYMAWGQLWEDGFGEGGSVRIWRRWPLRIFRFRDRRCVDRDLHRRIRRLGMRRLAVDAGEVFGTHYPRQTPFARFSKAKNDCIKWSVLGRSDLIESFYADVDISKFASPVPEALGLLAASLCRKRNQSKNLQEDWWEYQRLMNEHRLHDADLILR